MQARLHLVFPSEAFDSVTSNPLAAAAVAAMIYVAADRHAITTVRLHQRATLGGGPLRSEPAGHPSERSTSSPGVTTPLPSLVMVLVLVRLGGGAPTRVEGGHTMHRCSA